MKKVKRILFSPILMAVLLLVSIVAMAVTTFIENDFGSEFARLKVYNTKWFEIIFIFLAINLFGRIIELKLYRVKKLPVFLFHVSFIVMIIGAGITRYIGYEGTMHIREGHSSSQLITSDQLLKVTLNQPQKKEQVFLFTTNISNTFHFKEEVELENTKLSISLKKFYEHAVKKPEYNDMGRPIVGFFIAGKHYRGFEYLEQGEVIQFGDIVIAFDKGVEANAIISMSEDTFYIESVSPFMSSEMGNKSSVNIEVGKTPIKVMKIYTLKDYNLVFQEMHLKAVMLAEQVSEEDPHSSAMKAFVFDIKEGSFSTELTLWEDDWNGETIWSKVNDLKVGISLGRKLIDIPFSLYLDDFKIERYPGSNSPSSFSSYVTILDEGTEPELFHIYMNNILKHKGYRFYQSSYDEDEHGTILSVNHDRLGTSVTYLGYFLLFTGIMLSMFNRKSFFRNTIVKMDKATMILVILLFTGITSAHSQTDEIPVDHRMIDKEHAERFGKLLVQNSKGRTEPIYTFSSELMRKISRKEKLYGYTPVQLFMEMNMNPEKWVQVPIIKVSNPTLQKHLGIVNEYASYNDFITPHYEYKLQKLINEVYAKPKAQHNKFDKAVIKADEKVNICYAIFTGSFLKVFPVPGNDEDQTWYTSLTASQMVNASDDSIFLSNILQVYFHELYNGKATGDYAKADEYLSGILKYQQSYAGYELPSKFKVNIEVLYYKQNPFKKLFPFYATTGLLYLILLIVYIVSGKELPNQISRLFFFIILFGFIFHTLGVIARWYVSGHAPMSNGYESMIFISWVTILAGFIFSKRSPFSLSATSVLAGLTLMVANLSFMDPEITNLVPVLQSFWLTIHVSVITGSYAFLGLGAILGLINLIIIILHNKDNRDRILETLENVTIINHKTLILGLYFLTIGTFLGAIWANESWGRYWGWDPKETWALISVLVYTIVVHARLIPGIKGVFTFNVLSLFAFSSILMTYFGVNYYLSGLHSYAGGDPVPFPSFVYYSVISLLLLAIISSIRYYNSFIKSS